MHWNLQVYSSVGWDCRIHRMHLCQGVRLPQRVSWYDTKQLDGEAPVMLEFWGRWGIPSLPSLPGPHWPRVVAPSRVLSRSQIELNCVFMINWIVWNRTVFMLNWIVWNRTFTCFKMVLALITYNGWCAKKTNKPKQNVYIPGGNDLQGTNYTDTSSHHENYPS